MCCFFLSRLLSTQKKIEEKERQLESVPLSRFCPIIIYILIESGLKSARALVSTERKDHHHHHHPPRGFSIIPREREREREREKKTLLVSTRAEEREARWREIPFFLWAFFPKRRHVPRTRATDETTKDLKKDDI